MDDLDNIDDNNSEKNNNSPFSAIRSASQKNNSLSSSSFDYSLNPEKKNTGNFRSLKNNRAPKDYITNFYIGMAYRGWVVRHGETGPNGEAYLIPDIEGIQKTLAQIMFLNTPQNLGVDPSEITWKELSDAIGFIENKRLYRTPQGEVKEADSNIKFPLPECVSNFHPSADAFTIPYPDDLGIEGDFTL